MGPVPPADNARNYWVSCQCTCAVWLLYRHVPSCSSCHQALCIVLVVFAFFISQVFNLKEKEHVKTEHLFSLFITLPNQFVCLMYGFILAAAYLTTTTQSKSSLTDLAYVFVNLEVCSIISPWLTRAELCLVPLLVGGLNYYFLKYKKSKKNHVESLYFNCTFNPKLKQFNALESDVSSTPAPFLPF